MNRLMSSLAAQSSLGYLLVRLLTGFILAQAGYAKFFVAGISEITHRFETWGVPLAQLSAPLVGALELVGGILLIAGLFTRYVAVLFVIEFIVAAYTKWIPMGQGYAGARVDLMILVVALLFATNGAGSMSIDAKTGRS